MAELELSSVFCIQWNNGNLLILDYFPQQKKTTIYNTQPKTRNNNKGIKMSHFDQIPPDIICTIVMSYLPPKTCFILFEVLRYEKSLRYMASLRDNVSIIERSVDKCRQLKKFSDRKQSEASLTLPGKIAIIRKILYNKRKEWNKKSRCDYCFDLTGEYFPKSWRKLIGDHTSCARCCIALYSEEFIGRAEAQLHYGAKQSDFFSMEWYNYKHEYIHLRREVLQKVQIRLNSANERRMRYRNRKAKSMRMTESSSDEDAEKEEEEEEANDTEEVSNAPRLLMIDDESDDGDDPEDKDFKL